MLGRSASQSHIEVGLLTANDRTVKENQSLQKHVKNLESANALLQSRTQGLQNIMDLMFQEKLQIESGKEWN